MTRDWSIRKRRPVRRKNIAPLLKDLEEALEIFKRVGEEVGVIGPNKEAMAEHWVQMAEQMAI